MAENERDTASSIASALSDYRFCVYRLSVLREGPDRDGPAAAAVAARIARLVAEYPSIRGSHENLLRIPDGSRSSN